MQVATLRSLVLAIAMLVGVAMPAFAHAVLVSTDPAAGAVLNEAPSVVTIRFSEPTNPVVLRMTDPGGETSELDDYVVQGYDILVTLNGLAQGTHVVSWRVVSADGHPVGGAVVFSVGTVTGDGSAVEIVDPLLRALIWVVRVALYVALFAGAAGTFFVAWIAAPTILPTSTLRVIKGLMILGLVAVPFAFVLQGLDLRGEPVTALLDPAVWQTSLESSYTATLIAAAATFVVGLISLYDRRRAKALSALALLGIGGALALSGHASSAPPQQLTWFVVLMHGSAVAFWVGSLLPLIAMMGQPDRHSLSALSRFSKAIPNAIAAMIVAGALLILVQIRQPSDLWTSSYGLILSAKLLLVVILLLIAVANRMRLTPLVNAEPLAGGPLLRRSIIVELVLIFCVFGLVAWWRFTPPPRSITQAEQLALQIPVESPQLSANVTLTQAQVGPVTVRAELSNTDRTPLEAKEMSVEIANPASGIETLVQEAHLVDGAWQADFVVPVDGEWTIKLIALISDFDRRIADGRFTIIDPSAPATTGPAPIVAADGHVHALTPEIDVSDPVLAVSVDPADAPSLGLRLEDAGEGKMSLSFDLQKFRFGTEADGIEHKPGLGHGHIYLNGSYEADAEGDGMSLNVGQGVTEIYVNLSALDHRAYATEGRAIGAKAVVLRGRTPISADRNVIDVPVALGEAPPTYIVKQGETVELRLASPDDQIIHLHGYDIETGVPHESPVKIIFNADYAGRFAAEAHDDNQTVAFFLEVQP